MNKRSFRLIFNHDRGMLVAAAEHVRSAGKVGSGSTRARRSHLAWAAAVVCAGVSPSALSATGIPLARAVASTRFAQPNTSLPRPMPMGGTTPFVQSGSITIPVRVSPTSNTTIDLLTATPDQAKDLTLDPNNPVFQDRIRSLVINQQSLGAILNWRSFNINIGYGVEFVQPSGGSTLNKIWDADPTVILGSIKANGQVLLENTNGIIFGPTARVDTGRFVATALVTNQANYLSKGIGGVLDATPSFDGTGSTDPASSYVNIERGAEIRAAAGGDVLIFAPRVINAGRIETPRGQTILGAGQTVYLAATGDPAQRGLLVGINPVPTTDRDLNTVTQVAAGTYKTVNGQTVDDATPDSTAGLAQQINAVVAEKGSINLVGMAIRQNGVLQATTAVKGQNGNIQLLAQASVQPDAKSIKVGDTVELAPQTLTYGSVVFGAGSRTEVLPSSSTSETQLDSDTFYKSKIHVEGQQIVVQGRQTRTLADGSTALAAGAALTANSGIIELLAGGTFSTSAVFGGSTSAPANDASRLVIGNGASLSVAGLKNVDIPMSRNQQSGRLFQIELADSPVQRNGVLYRQMVYFDGRKKVSVADVSGFYKTTITRTAAEKSVTGGTLLLASDGGLAIDSGANLDISGGSIRYGAGNIQTSYLVKNGAQIPIDQALASVRYDALNITGRTTWNAAYTEGANAGTATLFGQRIYLGSAVNGQTISGKYQDGRTRTPPSAGSLVVGTLDGNPVNVLSRISVLANSMGTRPDSLFGSPLSASVDNISATFDLSANLLSAGGIGALTLGASTQDVAAEVHLLFGPGGHLASLGPLTLNGSFTSPGGSVDLKSNLNMGSQASIDVSGTWVDDRFNALQSTNSLPVVSVNGGTVSVGGRLSGPSSASINVSAGAWRGSSTVLGSAGSITLADGFAPGIKLSGFDFASGGKLNVGLQDADQANVVLGQGAFTRDLFLNHGFGQITISTVGNITVPAALGQLDLSLTNYVLQQATPFVVAGSSAKQSSAPSVEAGTFATLQTKADPSQRSAITLTLDASTKGEDGYRHGSVAMESGAGISTEAGGQITLKAGGNLTIGGNLSAPGGALNLSIAGDRGSDTSGSPDSVGFLPDQAIWLTSTARLSVAGTEATIVDNLGRKTGKVYGGGTINLNASRGYVIAQQGSHLDLSGYASDLYANGFGHNVLTSRDAGSLNISTPEGFVLDGSLRAQAPNAQAEGGTFNAVVHLTTAPLYPATAYPRDVRRIEVNPSSNSALGNAEAGKTNIFEKIGNGTGYVSAQKLMQAGFANIGLHADSVIALGAGTSLVAARSITLDALTLTALGKGITTTLQAPYVALGSQRNNSLLVTEVAPVALAGPTDPTSQNSLAVQAGLIEVYGSSALQNWNRVGLAATLDASGGNTRSDGEIRLIGKALGSSTNLVGNLAFSGELDLLAGNTYATTLTQFTVQGSAGSSLVTSAPNGSTSATPLSALATLSLQADDISLGGVIRQPFGNVSVKAVNSLTVSDTSVTSVSGTSTTVPVGTTVNGVRWIYRVGGTSQAVDSSGAQQSDFSGLPVAKSVSFSSKTLNISSAAQVSAAGGGDLQAWEFVSGVGGSSDYLSKSNLFAVIKDYHYDFAPYDTEVMATSGGSLRPGMKIHITMAGSGLAPGWYTLLPARYALLSGAALVSLATDQGKSVLQQAINNDDGSAIVSGAIVGGKAAKTSAGNSDIGTRILVETASTYLAKSQESRSSINDFLRSAAAASGEATPTLPSDAGRASFSAVQPFSWNMRLDLSGQTGSKAGELDLSVQGARLAIVDDVSAPGADHAESQGWTLLSASTLSQSKAGSVLIGGTRSGVDDVQVTTTASQIDVLATRSTISSSELLFTAQDEVTIASGVKLVATGTASDTSRTLSLNGDGAFVMVTGQSNADVTRAGAKQKSGALTIASGAELSGAAVRLNATGLFNLSAGATLTTNSVGLAAQQLVVGTPTGAVSSKATVLDGKLLSTLKGVQDLQLGSFSTIDFYGSQVFNQANLTLDAPNLRGMGSASDSVQLNAKQVRLRNTSGLAADQSLIGNSSLSVNASPALAADHTGGLLIGPGKQYLGFKEVQLASSGDVIFNGQGRLLTQGNTTISAARVTARGTQTDHGVTTSGLLKFSSLSGGHTLGERLGQGAKLTFNAVAIDQNTWIDAPSGTVSFNASGSSSDNTCGRSAAICFGAASKTQAAGFAIPVTSDWTVYGPGGTINATADKGDIILAGLLDVSAPQAGNASAGTVNISTPQGAFDFTSTAQLLGGGGSDNQALSGSLSLDAQQLERDGTSTSGQIDELAQLLNAGEFNQEISLRLRSGDMLLSRAASGTGKALKAARVTLTADQGGIEIDGTINAQADAGGVVRLYARDDITLGAADGSVAQILASSSRTGGQGGDVLLSSESGYVNLNAGARIDARGDDGSDPFGRVIFRAQRDDADGTMKVNFAQGFDSTTLIHAGEIDLEAVKIYSNNQQGNAYTRLVKTSSSATDLTQSKLLSDSNTFLTNASSLLSNWGLDGDSRVLLRTGIEIQASGAFTVVDDWNLHAAATADSPQGPIGFLTIRAAGDLNLKGSISDGFVSATRPKLSTTSAPTELVAITGTDANGNAVDIPYHASSYRLVGGADLLSSNLLNTGSTGNLTVSGNKLIRTTSGSIEMAAGNDLSLLTDGKTQAVVYSAGRTSTLIDRTLATLVDADGNQIVSPATVSQWQTQYTSHGGRVELTAGHDVMGQAATQSFGAWFYHAGSGDGEAVQWWSSFDDFRMGVGSFGGGSVRVNAGNDVQNLNVVAPTSGLVAALVGTVYQNTVENGGDITVRAGNDILGGSYFLGRGQGRLVAGNSVTVGASTTVGKQSISAEAPILALMDGNWHVEGDQSVEVAAVVNPTLLPSAIGHVTENEEAIFSSYSSASGMSVRSTSGDVKVESNLVSVLRQIANGDQLPNSDSTIEASSNPTSLNAAIFKLALVAPPNMDIVSLGGDVNFAGHQDKIAFAMAPSATGTLNAYASGNIKAPTLATIEMLDDSSVLPTALDTSSLAINEGSQLFVLVNSSDIGLTSGTVTHTGLHQADSIPNHLHADGDISGASTSAGLPTAFELNSAKVSEVTAGSDMYIHYTGQQWRLFDTTVLEAGRNLKGWFTVGGPGQVDWLAGRQLSLGELVNTLTQGASTTGNLVNAALSANGATANVAAGLNATLDLDLFVTRYLTAGNDSSDADALAGRNALVRWVRSALDPLGMNHADLPTTFDAALTAFRSFSSTSQVAFARQLLTQRFEQTYLTSGKTYAATWASAITQGLVLPALSALSASDLSVYQAAHIDTALLSAFGLPGQATTDWRQAVQDAATTWNANPARLTDHQTIDLDKLSQTTKQVAQTTASGTTQRALGNLFERVRTEILFDEIKRLGNAASSTSDKVQRDALYSQAFHVIDLAGLGDSFTFKGDLSLAGGNLFVRRGGGINLLAPGGQIVIGLSGGDLDASGNVRNNGAAAFGQGNFYALAAGDFQVNSQKAFVVGKGDLTVWSSHGDIDAGRGANTAVGQPALVAVRHSDGSISFDLPDTTVGSGIGILKPASGEAEGDIGLYAPNGEILALDAQIRAPGRISLAAEVVRGADNIAGGSVVGAPVVLPSVSISISSPPASGDAQNVSEKLANSAAKPSTERNSLLTVELLGLGDMPNAGDGEGIGNEVHTPNKAKDSADDCANSSGSNVNQGKCSNSRKAKGGGT